MTEENKNPIKPEAKQIKPQPKAKTQLEKYKETFDYLIKNGVTTDLNMHYLWEMYTNLVGRFPGQTNCDECVESAILHLHKYFKDHEPIN